MRRIIYVLFFILYPLILNAQDPNGNYNPFVSVGKISPAPLWPMEADGNGIVSFNVGNSGLGDLEVYTDHFITLTIPLSYGLPDNANPTAAIGGSSAGLFNWSFNTNTSTYSAVQIATIPANSSGSITIDYKVSRNSSTPGLNGFNVNITPAPYQTTSNKQVDDAVNFYTYTEIRDFGDAPSSYGSADHILDFANYLGAKLDGEAANQPSATANADDTNGEDDEDGVIFPSQLHRGESYNLQVTIVGAGRLNAWIDWNGDGDFVDGGEQITSNFASFGGVESLPITVPADAIITTPTFARFRFSPGTLSNAGGSAIGGEVEDYRISISGSVLIPTVPMGLTITSSTLNSVSLSWDASTDNIAVTGYRIYRGGVLLGTTTALSYTDNTVSIGNYYTYTVTAFDADANESEPSMSVSTDINDITPPTVPTGLAITSSSENSVSISWDAAEDNVGVKEYLVYRGGSLMETVKSLSFTDITVSPGNSYTYTVSAIDAAGNASAQSQGVTADITDTSPPTTPGGLAVTSTAISSVSISWNAASDNVGVTAYRIYREGIILGTSLALSFTDSDLSPGYSYTYAVSAIDEAGNESDLSAEVTASHDDTTPPEKPTGLQALTVSATGLSLVWDESSDNIGVTAYRVYRAGDLVTTVNAPSYEDKTVLPGNTYSYKVSALDAAGNESLHSDPLTISITSSEYLIVSKLSVYPNPSRGKFVIEINEKSGRFNLEIVSANGLTVAQNIINLSESEMPLTFDTLETGIYYIRIFNNERIYYGKLMILK